MMHCRDTAMEAVLSHPRTSCPGPTTAILLIPGNPNFDYLLTVRCAGFLHFKASPLVIASLSWDSTWIICKFLFLIIFSATHLSILWWFLPKTVTTIICQMVIFYFCDSFHIYQLEFYCKEDFCLFSPFVYLFDHFLYQINMWIFAFFQELYSIAITVHFVVQIVPGLPVGSQSLQVVPCDMFGSLPFTSVPAAGACLTRTCCGQACVRWWVVGPFRPSAHSHGSFWKVCPISKLVQSNCRVAQLLAAQHPLSIRGAESFSGGGWNGCFSVLGSCSADSVTQILGLASLQRSAPSKGPHAGQRPGQGWELPGERAGRHTCVTLPGNIQAPMAPHA